MTYREAITVILALLALLALMRFCAWFGGILFGTRQKPRVERSVTSAPSIQPALAPAADSVIRNVEVLTADEVTRPRMGFLWHVVPSDHNLRDLAIERLERGWKYANHREIKLQGMRYVATCLPSVPPTPRPKGIK